MPCMLDAFGLKELGEDSERFIGFLRLCVAKGYSVEGYRGAYCGFDYGDMSFGWSRRRPCPLRGHPPDLCAGHPP